MWKLYFLQTILSLLIFYTLGNDDFFAKFHQHQFKIREFRAELDYYNPDIYRVFELRTFKYNRSLPAVNLTMQGKVDFDGTKIEMLVQAYKFASNEKRHFPVRFQANFLKALRADLAGMKQNILRCGNFPLMGNFYFYKDVVYRLCNATIHENNFPPLIPSGRYQLQFTLFAGNLTLAIYSGYGDIYVPIKIQK